MAKITVIPQTINPLTKLPTNGLTKRKVAGYARVSTDSDEQFTSYEAQVDYYTNFIKQHSDWEFVKVYTDEGISGTNTKRRVGFNSMIEDALDGKIDLIVTKSVSRFARNTVDSLITIRKLKEKGVECFFEKENIYTLDSKGELLLTIMSSIAQEESRSISENVTWGQRKAMSDGKVRIPIKNFLGYKKSENGDVVVDEEEAKIVRLIYRMFLDGKTPVNIATKLTELNVKTPSGKGKWSLSTVLSILTNEKYKGDALLQKTFTVDFLQHKVKKNEGEVPQYYVHKSHPSIIEETEWDRVQVEIERRKKLGYGYSGTNTFSSKVLCGDCGSVYGRKVWHSNDEYRAFIWQCNRKFKNANKCKTPHIKEEVIQNAFIKAYNQIAVNKKKVIEGCNLMIASILDLSELNSQIEEQTDVVSILVDRANKMISENSSRAISQEEYLAKYEQLMSKYEVENKKLEELNKKKQRKLNQKKEIEVFMKLFKESPDVLTEWNGSIFNLMIEKVVVHNRKKLEFNFLNGDKVEIFID